jgi:hypothetical protein
MPKVGNKTFPYTSKGIDDAKKEKKRISSGGTALKRKPKMIGEKWIEPPSVKKVSPYAMPRKPRDPNRVGPVKMPTVPKKRPDDMATIKPAKRRPVKTSPMKVPKPATRRAVRTSPMKREK